MGVVLWTLLVITKVFSVTEDTPTSRFIGWSLFYIFLVLIVGLFAAAIYFLVRRAAPPKTGDEGYLAYVYARMAALEIEIAEERKASEVKVAKEKKKSDAKIEKLQMERNEWRRVAQEYTKLREDLEEKGVIEKKPESRVGMKVLGIWPEVPQGTPLDLKGSRDAIYDAGFEFVPLFAEHANRIEILQNLRKGEISIVEIGGHGTSEGVPLADGLARAGWWEGVLRDRGHIRIVLFLTCFSDQGMFEAVKRAGIPHIITVNGEIRDAAAVSFAQAFYSNYANGQTVEAAVKDAKLILDYTEAAKIELSKTTKES